MMYRIKTATGLTSEANEEAVRTCLLDAIIERNDDLESRFREILLGIRELQANASRDSLKTPNGTLIKRNTP